MAGTNRTPMQKIQDAGLAPLQSQPDKGKGSSLTVGQLAERYGENAREVYFRVALAAGYGNLRNVGYATLPPLDTTGLSAEGREAMNRVLAEADAEFNPKPAEPETAKE